MVSCVERSCLASATYQLESEHRWERQQGHALMQQAAGRHPQWEAMRKLALQQPLEQQGCGERQRSWAVEVMLIAMFLGLLVARWSSKQAATSPC